MGIGWVTPGFGASSLRSLTKSNAPAHIYISALNGSDTTGLGTQASPLASLGMLDALLPDDILHPIDVSLDAGVHLLPENGTWLRSRIGNNTLRIYGDAVWDPSVNQVLHQEPAGAGTTVRLVKQTGMAVNIFRGKTLEVTSAGGVVQRKLIKSNTATDVIPTELFNPAPAVGDQVRITRSMAVLQMPTVAGAFELYKLSRDRLTSRQSPFAGQFGTPVSIQQVGLILENIALLDSASFGGWSFGLGVYYMYGVELRVATFGKPIFLLGSQVFAGLSLNGRENDAGFGISAIGYGSTTPSVRVYADGTLTGFFVGDSAAPSPQPGGSIALWSGYSRRVPLFTAGNFAAFGNSDSTIPFTVEDINGAGALDMHPLPNQSTPLGPAASLSFAVDISSGVGPGLVVYNGSTLILGASVTGVNSGLAVDVRSGGCVYVEANPQYGGPAGLWKTPNTAGVTRASFVPGFALVDPVDTSAIIVTS